MKLVIIGNGITGLCAARTVRKNLPDARIQMVSSEHPYPFARTALMYVYMGRVSLEATECNSRDFYKTNRIELLFAHAERADTALRKVHLSGGQTLDYDCLLIASGSVPARYGWPGQDLTGVHGLYSLQDLSGIEEASRAGIQKAVLVGGGLIGVELAEMLRSRQIPVTMLVRESSYAPHILPAEESNIVAAEIRRHGVDLRFRTNLAAITADADGRAAGVRTENGEEITCNFVGLTAGVLPRIDFAKASNVHCDKGILVNDFFETSAEGVFAAGDCAQFHAAGRAGRIEQLWYTGRIQGTAAGMVLCDALTKKKPANRYAPDVFFNSAKFFEIEYQAYGSVPPDSRSLFIEDAPKKRSIRIAFSNDESRQVLGFVLLGVRYRQQVCQQWIREKKSIDTVLDELDTANFDPEFSERYEQALRDRARKVFA